VPSAFPRPCETARLTLRSILPARVNKNADICSPQALFWRPNGAFKECWAKQRVKASIPGHFVQEIIVTAEQPR
jgi:hypothetical protein